MKNGAVNGAVIVFKKELMRFFSDKRLLFTTVIMPGLLIYIIYTLMGRSMGAMMDNSTSEYRTAVVNAPESIIMMLKENNFDVEKISIKDADDAKQRVKDEDLALYVVFPEDFETAIVNFDPSDPARDVPDVEIYYNSANINSAQGYSAVLSILDETEKAVSNVFNVNSSGEGYDLATEQEAAGAMLAMILPMLLITMMFSSCTSIAPESIAGEKERGTIATLLITPVPRAHIILGKVGALSIMALLGGLSSFLGTLLSLPALMQTMGEEMTDISSPVYKAPDYIMLLALIMATVILFITLISIISTFAKNVKESGTLVMPLMLVVMMMSVMSMFGNGDGSSIGVCFIPIYNTVQSMAAIFSFHATALNITITVVMDLVYSLIGIAWLTVLFDDERIMYTS